MTRTVTTLVGLVALLVSGSGFVHADEPQLAHMVFFTLADDTAANRKQLIEACHKHLAKHAGVTHFSAGAVAEDLQREVNDREFHVALHLVFADKKSHDTYQTHARHLKFIADNKHLWKKVRVFDSYVQSSAPSLRTIDDLLAAKVSVRFDQLSLHGAMESIQNSFNESHESELPLKLEIVGRDLQSEGITRNQLIRNFAESEQTLAAVLTKIVGFANPVRVKSLSDPNQKLIWVPSPDGKSILITTRAAAKQKKYSVPKVFEK